MDGLDLLGAMLADQYVVLRVRSVDKDKLKAKLGGARGQLASSIVTMVDVSAKAALDATLPIAVGKAREYGVELEVSSSMVPPKLRSRAISEFWPGLLIGGLLGGTGFGIVKLVGRLFGRK